MKVKYDQSRVMKRAWKLFKAQEIRTMEQWSVCLTQSHNIEKNGIKEVTFDAVYNKYHKQIYVMVLNMVNRNEDVAQEITNDTFLRANEHLNNYDVQRANLNTWLNTIAKNLVIDHFRKYKNDTHINVSKFADTETGKETFQMVDNSQVNNVENDELSDAIEKAMQSLKPKYREVAELFFNQQKKYDEICKLLNLPMGSVKGMISRARTMLQEQLQGVRTA